MPKVFELICDHRHFPEHGHILVSRQLSLNEVLVLPPAKPDIERLVDVKATPIIDSHKIISSVRGKKAVIKGHIEEEILYVADAPCQPVHAVHFSWPFTTFIDLPCGCANYALLEQFVPKIIVEYIGAEQICTREITKNVIVFVWYPVFDVVPPPPPRHNPRWFICQREDDHKHKHRKRY